MIKKILSETKIGTLQTEDKKNYAEELIVANKKLAIQVTERQNRAEELIIANQELAFQNIEKEKREIGRASCRERVF